MANLLNDLTKQYNDAGNNIKKYATYGKGDKLNSRMFNQLMILDRPTLGMIQPFIGGRFIIAVAEMPQCMQLLFPEETDYIKLLFTTAVLSVSGFNSRTLTTSTIQAGTDQNTYDVVTKQEGATRSLSFTFMTLWQSLPMYKYITTWMQYIYNAGSSASTYPHYTPLEYHEGNHSMNLLYIIPDPSYKRVEAAAAIYAMVPTDNQAGTIYNQTFGEHNTSSYEIPFKCSVLPTEIGSIMYEAQLVLNDFVATRTLQDYDVDRPLMF